MSALVWGDSPNVIEVNFHPNAETLNRRAAARAAFERAVLLGFGKYAAAALKRTAFRDWSPGETAEACANRLVRPLHETVKPHGPKGAA